MSRIRFASPNRAILPPMKRLSLLCFFVLLSACPSYRKEMQQQEAAQSRFDEVNNSLKVGMTFEQVKALAPEMANCHGNEKGLNKCSIHIAISSTQSPDGHYLSEQYRHLWLTFEEGKLSLWTEEKKGFLR